MLEISGKQYRTNLPGTMQLRTMRRVKLEFGFGWSEISNFVENLSDDTLLGDLMTDDRFLGWMWAWVINAGDDMTRAEFEALTIADINFTEVDAPPGDAEAGDEVPTSAPTDSGRGANDQPAGARPPRSGKTSNKRSSRD